MYTMMEACRETDMTYQALKFYCNEGLVPNVKRDKNNRRVFDERDVKWIRDLVCLKKCGMSIQEMKAYLDLCLQGPSTIPARKEMLTKKQEDLRRSIQELEESVAYIDWKQNFYDEVLSGKRPLREQPHPHLKREFQNCLRFVIPQFNGAAYHGRQKPRKGDADP